MRFCSSRRAISKRPCSISLMALSNSTLSGCWVSLVMGLAYFFLRRIPPLRSTVNTKPTAVERITFRSIINQSPLTGLCTPLYEHESAFRSNRSLTVAARIGPERPIRAATVRERLHDTSPSFRTQYLTYNPGSLHCDLHHLA